jgi:hypothetical protein
MAACYVNDGDEEITITRIAMAELVLCYYVSAHPFYYLQKITIYYF